MPFCTVGTGTSESLIQLLRPPPLHVQMLGAHPSRRICLACFFLSQSFKVFATRASIASSPKLELSPFNRLIVSLNSCLSAESVVSPHAL
jgi:hypothetical protein